jgi:hypothetical protein
MASNSLQGKKVYLRISPDGGTNKYVLVCLIKQGFEGDIAVNETETQCETLVGLGSNKNKFTFEAAINTSPAALVSNLGECSHQKLLEWYNAQTELTIEQFLPTVGTPLVADAAFYKSSKGYITQYKDDAPVNDIIKCSGAFSLFGTLDITA